MSFMLRFKKINGLKFVLVNLHSAGPATLQILFLIYMFALVTTKYYFEAWTQTPVHTM